MELKEFVKESLLQISEALHEANESYKVSRKTDQRVFVLCPGGDKKSGTGVHFDLAVVSRTETGTGGKAGINIKVVEMSTGGESQQAKENVSRISFTVTIDHYVG